MRKNDGPKDGRSTEFSIKTIASIEIKIEFQAAEEEEQLEREWHLRESFRQAQVEYRDALDEEEVKRMAQLKNDHQPRSNRKRAS